MVTLGLFRDSLGELLRGHLLIVHIYFTLLLDLAGRWGQGCGWRKDKACMDYSLRIYQKWSSIKCLFPEMVDDPATGPVGEVRWTQQLGSCLIPFLSSVHSALSAHPRVGTHTHTYTCTHTYAFKHILPMAGFSLILRVRAVSVSIQITFVLGPLHPLASTYTCHVIKDSMPFSLSKCYSPCLKCNSPFPWKLICIYPFGPRSSSWLWLSIHNLGC